MGKEKLLSLGVYPTITLANARKERDQAKRQHQKALRELDTENSFSAIARERHQRHHY